MDINGRRSTRLTFLVEGLCRLIEINLPSTLQLLELDMDSDQTRPELFRRGLLFWPSSFRSLLFLSSTGLVGRRVTSKNSAWARFKASSSELDGLLCQFKRRPLHALAIPGRTGAYIM